MTIDSMFPLLKLPLLCIQEITDQWKLIELYNFSLLSKRAKGISKRNKWNGSEVELKLHNRSLSIRKDQKFNCLFFERNRYRVGMRKVDPVDPDVFSFFKATEHFMDVLNCPFRRIDVELKPPLTNDQLIKMIDWMNGMKIEIKRVYIDLSTVAMFKSFMDRFQRSIEDLEVQDPSSRCEGINYKRIIFEIKHEFFSNSSWFNLDFLLSMDCEYIETNSSDLSAEDLNMFLRSWQEGKTNRKLNRIHITTCEGEIMRQVLRGCGAELIDPRTTKLKFRDSVYNWIKLIHGGIHFRRNDGRLAVIDISFYSTEEVSEEHIEKYLRTLEKWNSEDEIWYETRFHIYFF